MAFDDLRVRWKGVRETAWEERRFLDYYKILFTGIWALTLAPTMFFIGSGNITFFAVGLLILVVATGPLAIIASALWLAFAPYVELLDQFKEIYQNFKQNPSLGNGIGAFFRVVIIGGAAFAGYLVGNAIFPFLGGWASERAGSYLTQIGIEVANWIGKSLSVLVGTLIPCLAGRMMGWITKSCCGTSQGEYQNSDSSDDFKNVNPFDSQPNKINARASSNISNAEILSKAGMNNHSSKSVPDLGEPPPSFTTGLNCSRW